MVDELTLEALYEGLRTKLSGFLNTGLVYCNIIKSNAKHSADYIKLIFERDDKKYHTPKIFTSSDPSQNMIRIYKLSSDRFLIDVCSRTYEIDNIKTFWVPNVRTKHDLYQLRQVEGSICHVIDANQDYVFAWGSWIPLNLLKPKKIYQSDIRRIIEFHTIEDLADVIFNNREKFTSL